jgi:hypothetical protein
LIAANAKLARAIVRLYGHQRTNAVDEVNAAHRFRSNEKLPLTAPPTARAAPSPRAGQQTAGNPG